MPTAYCFVCDWQRTVGDEEITVLSRAMIDHHIDTGHSPIEQQQQQQQQPTRADRGERGDTSRVLYDDWPTRDDHPGSRNAKTRLRSDRR